MLQKIKKMIPLVAMVLLFSSTIMYAYDIEEYMTPGLYVYSSLRIKNTTTGAASVVSVVTPNDRTVRYRVYNKAGYRKSVEVIVPGVDTVDVSYSNYGVVKGDYVKLRAENNNADNGGRFFTLQSNWTP